MAIARFFERNYAAVGAALSISRDALERTLAARTIGLLCGPNVAGDANARWTAEMAVALLARLYPKISLEAPPALADALAALALAINPLVEIVRPDDTETTIVIGEHRSPVPPNAIFAGAHGWVAHVARTPVPIGGPENPYSAGAAGCIAVGEAFRQVFRASLRPWVEPRDIALSLLDYGPGAGASLPVPDVYLSEVAFFGLGAVANGALWAIGRHRAVRGVAWLIDAETVDLSNLQRYVLTLDVDEGLSKPDLAAEALRGTGLEPRPRAVRLEEFADRYRTGFSIPYGLRLDGQHPGEARYPGAPASNRPQRVHRRSLARGVVAQVLRRRRLSRLPLPSGSSREGPHGDCRRASWARSAAGGPALGHACSIAG
jgi:hypothetical protein